jgi:transcriptional regulator with XRE-family HTH domain
MARHVPPLLPRVARLITGLGENIRKARLRRAFSTETVAERAGITRKTLYRVERGDPAVALGIYARVLQALRLENDLAAIALDDVLGRKLQDANLGPKRRAPKGGRRADTPAGGSNPTKFPKRSEDLP